MRVVCVLLTAFLPAIIEGRSDGAPQCVKIPGHGVKSKSRDEFDKMYSVSITKSADSDNRWVVKVVGKGGNKFKGFLIRPAWSNQGVLSGGSNGLYRTITDGCEGIDGVTHRDPDEKTEVSVEFTPDESDLKMLNMTLVLAKTRTEVFEERTFTGFAEEGTGSDRASSTSSTTARFNSQEAATDNDDTTERDTWNNNNGQRTTDRFGESTERNGPWNSNNGQRTTDRFGNFETTERNGQDSWNNNGQRTTDRFGNSETTQRNGDSWNNNGQRTTDRFGNFDTTQRNNNGQDSWNNGQRTTERFGNFDSTTTDRFGRTSTTTTDRYGDEYSDDRDHDNDHHDDRDHNNNNNSNGWPNQDDRERNPIAGQRTTTQSSTTSRFTNRVPIPRDQPGSGSGVARISVAVGSLLMLAAYAVML